MKRHWRCIGSCQNSHHDMIGRFIKNYFLLFLLILLSLPAIFALFHTGFFSSDDGEWMIIRLSAFYEIFRNGEIPVRFIARLNNGYGYPLANFMYPGYLYLGSLLHIVGFSFVSSIKIILGFSMLFSGIFTYFWLQKLFTKTPAFFGALLYVYMPYHFFDMYTRGSVGELLALVIIPFILWQIERKDTCLTALSIALLVLSHNTLAFLFLIPLYLYGFIRDNTKLFIGRCIHASIPFLIGILLSAFFWLPALYDLQYTNFQSVIVSDWKQYFSGIQLIGFSTSLIMIAGFFLLFTKRLRLSPYRSLFYFFFLIGLISLYISSEYSYFFWTVFPSQIVQFPFRALSLVILSLAFVGAFLISIMPKKVEFIVGFLLLIAAVISCFSYLSPKEFFDKGESYYTTNFSTTTVKDEYMPKWVLKPLPPTPAEKVVIVSGKGVISQQKSIGNTVEVKVDLSENSTIQLNTIFFPGWRAFIDKNESAIEYENPNGLMQIVVPTGMHTLLFTFTETFMRILADILSIIGLFVLGSITLWKVLYNRK